jgi:hypothetical protein
VLHVDFWEISHTKAGSFHSWETQKNHVTSIKYEFSPFPSSSRSLYYFFGRTGKKHNIRNYRFFTPKWKVVKWKFGENLPQFELNIDQSLPLCNHSILKKIPVLDELCRKNILRLFFLCQQFRKTSPDFPPSFTENCL